MRHRTKIYGLEIAAVVILLALTGFSVFNCYYMEKITTELSADVTRAEELALSGEFDAAAAAVDGASRSWLRRCGYLYVIVRHEEIDQISGLFPEMSGILREHNAGEAGGAADKIRVKLTALRDMQRVTLSSVF